MRLTVLGSSASYAGAGEACAGFLVEAEGTRVLLDCGSGVVANLGRVTDPTRIDAVFVTHRHPDHFIDLFTLQAAIRYAPSGPVPVGPVPLFAPPGLGESMACLHDERGREDMRAAFAWHTLEDAAPVTIGALTVTPLPVDHIPGTFALRATDGVGVLCYTSDSRPGPLVETAASGADVLLAEATLPAEYAGKAPHMTAEEAGRLAASAGARQLVLTHLWPTADRGRLLADARAAFAGEVGLATEMMTLEVAGGGLG